jgi:putative aldouronate transport system permease protein
MIDTQPVAPQISPVPKKKARSTFSMAAYLKDNWTLLFLALPALLLIFMFSYVPNLGTVMAFQDFSPRTGFLSPFVGFRNFRILLDSPQIGRLIRNTLLLNTMFITAQTFFAVMIALLLNEVRSVRYKRILQSVMFLPYFMGWTLVAMVLYGLIDYEVGTINSLLEKVGLERILLTDNPQAWPVILTTIRVWKFTGSGCIIYLAVLVSVDPQLYEAAAIDGANRFQRARYISLPALIPTIVLLTLLAIGQIFYGDFGMIYAVVGNRALLYETTDVIDTYIMRALRLNSNYGFNSAVGLLQSVLGFICIFGANWAAKKYSQKIGEDYSLF